jgi:hypothetical protein
MKKFSDIRKLKSLTNPIKEGKSAIHPITLDLIINDNDYKIVPTQFFINDIDQINYNDIYKKQESKRTISDNMAIPDLSLPSTDILNVYNIDSYDELIQVIKNIKQEETLFRIVSLYTRIFYDDLKKSNNSLIKIFNIVFEDKNNNSDKIKKFLKTWFDKNNKDKFDLNICKDYKNFLSNNNKYESTK